MKDDYKVGDQVIYFRYRRGDASRTCRRILATIVKLNRARASIELIDGRRVAVEYENLEKVTEQKCS